MVKENLDIVDICRSVAALKMKALKIFDFIFGSLAVKLVKEKDIEGPIKMEDVKSILVIRPGGIGDAVFLLPFLRVLKKYYPKIKIDILCEKRNGSVFTSQPGICDQFFFYDQMSSFKSVFKQSNFKQTW